MKKLRFILHLCITLLLYFSGTAAFSDESQLELVPGFRVCSVYFNDCKAEDYSEISGKLYFRVKGKTDWISALEPAFVRHEKALRGSLLQLQENTFYELKLSVTDKGNRAEFVREFKTESLDVPIARTIELKAGDLSASWKPESGSPSGYIRYTAAPGTVLDLGKNLEEAIRLDSVSYVILDGLTLRGGRRHGISVLNSEHVRIINCDISGYGRLGEFRPDLDGKFYINGQSIWHDAGIQILNSRNLLVERNYIHDPDARGNSWFYSHPAGPTGLYVGNASAVALRYNDIIGSDFKRWNDGVDGKDNFKVDGGFRSDAEICGNYFAFGDDDGLELDGGQMNARFFNNRVEGFFCGISLAACMRGPSYVFNNLFHNPGDEYGIGGSSIKMISGFPTLWGPVFLLDNEIQWNSAVSFPPLPEQKSPLFLLYARGNRFNEGKPYPVPESARFTYDIDDSRSATEFLPSKPEIFPGRPVGFSIDRTEFVFNQDTAVPMKQELSIKADVPGFKSAFRIVQPEASKHFRVEPSSGLIEYGKPLKLTVYSCPEALRIPRYNSGAFSIRLANGFSRPVSVYVDTRLNPELLTAARSSAVFGEVKKLADSSLELRFNLPRDGEYYLFVKNRTDSTRLILQLDGGAKENRSLSRPLRTKNPWRCCSELFNVQKNRPFKLSAGEHVFRIEKQDNFKGPDYSDCALAADPDIFRLAPDDISN